MEKDKDIERIDIKIVINFLSKIHYKLFMKDFAHITPNDVRKALIYHEYYKDWQLEKMGFSINEPFRETININ